MPALSWKTQISQLRTEFKDRGVGYGRTYIANEGDVIATIPVGYADGFNRLFSNKGVVIINGKKVPLVGRVCMDMIMVDVTSLPDVCVGDEVVLIGSQGGEQISADDHARMLGTINYEITCNIGLRVPRVYVKAGEVCRVMNRNLGT